MVSSVPESLKTSGLTVGAKGEVMVHTTIGLLHVERNMQGLPGSFIKLKILKWQFWSRACSQGLPTLPVQQAVA